MSKKKFDNPYELVAFALQCDIKHLDPDAGWGHYPPEWDSFGQATLLSALEEEYGIVIEDDQVDQFKKMSMIINFHEERTNISKQNM